MSKTTIYDAIVVGAGPAGSTAGYLLSKSGLRVLIIDKSTFPRHKLCAGCLTYKTTRFLERVFGESVTSLKKQDIINFESNHYEIFFKNKLVDKKNINIPFHFVDRYSYDNFLLKKAQKTGAELIEGVGVESIDLTESVIKTSTGRKIKTRFIIGADGVNSNMRRSFPKDQFNDKVWKKNLATGLEIFINRSDLRHAINHPILYFDYISHGYSWVFPNSDKLIVGIGGLNQKNRKQFLHLFHNFLSVLNIGDLKTYKTKGYAFPYGNFMLEPVFSNVILVGDAAGFGEPFLGEGIFYAHRSAELAAKAVLKAMETKNNFETSRRQLATTYLQLLQNHIYPEFIYAKKIRYFVFTFFNKFNHHLLKILMNLLGNKPVETIHGIRTFKWMKKLPLIFLSFSAFSLHLLSILHDLFPTL